MPVALKHIEEEQVVRCAWCLHEFEVYVDVTAGLEQTYMEECQVCSRPNVLHVHIDPETLAVSIDVEQEG